MGVEERGEFDIDIFSGLRGLAYSIKVMNNKNERSQDYSEDMQEVGLVHSTDEASNDRGGKGLT